MVSNETHLVRRAGAAFVDYLFLSALFFGFLKIQPWAHPDNTGNYGCAGCLLTIPIALVWCVYFGYGESRFGRTLGKGLFDLAVERVGGRRLTLGACLKRHLLDPLELNFFGVPAIIAIKASPGHQRLGDMLAGTRVVLKPYIPTRINIGDPPGGPGLI